jgi:hypothetical protein
MKLLYPLFLAYPVLLLAACRNNHADLFIVNLSQKDSLRTYVQVNGDEIFDGAVQRPDSILDGVKQPFRSNIDLVHVKVEIPILDLKAIADTTISDLRSVYVIIRSKGVSIYMRSDTDGRNPFVVDERRVNPSTSSIRQGLP